VRGVSRAERDERVLKALDLVGLSAYGERYPRRMSGGHQQRVVSVVRCFGPDRCFD